MINDLLMELEEKGISISFSKGKLQYKGPENNIDAELISKLKDNKVKLIEHFWSKDCPNILPINPQGSKCPVFLIHGGSYFQISDDLGKDRPLYTFYYIGSETEDSRFQYNKIESFAKEYVRQLELVHPNGPCILLGFSIGGHVAYEMAMQFEKKGKEVPLLILVDSGISSYATRDISKNYVVSSLYYVYYKLRFRYILAENGYKRFKYWLARDAFKKLSIHDRTAYFVRIYEKLINKFKPKKKYKGEMLLFKASDTYAFSKYMGWDRVCDNITVFEYEGNHASMWHDTETINLIKTKSVELINKSE